jgi:hypothetical protein
MRRRTAWAISEIGGKSGGCDHESAFLEIALTGFRMSESTMLTETTIMDLQEGALYRTPDGRLLQAVKEVRQYIREPSWTLIPEDPPQREQTLMWREDLARLLFVEDGRLVCFQFDDGVTVRDTGWTVDDLRPE